MRQVINCKTCNKKIVALASRTKKKFCSRRCHWDSRKGKIEVTCLSCKQVFTTWRYRKESVKFCSVSCHNDFQWRGGYGSSDRGPNWRTQRNLALVRDSYRCLSCDSKENLTVHHMKPFRFFSGNYKIANKLNNLLTLCLPCHGREEGRHGYINSRKMLSYV